MRHVIWEKDDFFDNIGMGRYDMDPTVLVLPPPDGKLPLMWQFDSQRDPIGWVSDLKLEEGEITGEVEWLMSTMSDASLENMSCRLGVYIKGVVKNSASRVIEAGTLIGVCIYFKANAPGYGNPGAHIKKE